jgi:O-antigen/teichoic acid export membrane protein
MPQNENVIFGRHIGYVFVSNLLLVVLGFIRLPLLTKGLGPSGYGSWALITITVSFMVPFALLAFESSLVRFLAAEKNIRVLGSQFFSVFGVVIVSGSFFSLIIMPFSDLIAANIFKAPEVAGYIRLAAWIILFEALFRILLTYFRMRMQMGRYTILLLSYHISQILAISLALLGGYGLKGVIVGVILSTILMILIMTIAVGWQIGFYVPRFLEVKRYLKWGVPLTPNAAIVWIIESSDRYMLGFMRTPAEVGVYSVAYSVANFAYYFLSPLNTVLYPKIIKSYDEGHFGKTRLYLENSVKYLMLIIIPVGAVLSILSKPLLEILTTSSYGGSVRIIPILICSVMAFCLYQVFIYIVHLTNKTYLTLRILLVSAIINILLNLLLIPHYGILGAALATLAAYLFLGFTALVVTRRLFFYQLPIKFTFKAVCAAIVGVFPVWLIAPVTIVGIGLSAGLVALIYMLVLYAWGELSGAEVKFLKTIVFPSKEKPVLAGDAVVSSTAI